MLKETDRQYEASMAKLRLCGTLNYDEEEGPRLLAKG
jgi:hypothetical protein